MHICCFTVEDEKLLQKLDSQPEVCVYVFVCVCMYVCIYIYIYICMYVGVCLHANIYYGAPSGG